MQRFVFDKSGIGFAVFPLPKEDFSDEALGRKPFLALLLLPDIAREVIDQISHADLEVGPF